ncbi:recombinase family protein [Planctomicrobium sp. SH661]|uniref:recombinase family protein n=1 Tax=Planctomicrobium sp. SH661 TaxID=3448124 RepID=UPI003F5AF97D
MARKVPVTPRNGSVLRVVIVARISGCQNQKEISLDDQVDHAKQEIAELYDGPCEFFVISTTGKGERLDRPELREVEKRLEDRLDDLMFMEDVGRLVRGTAAVELWGIAVDNGIRCVAPNDGCDTSEPTWEEDLISACKDHVSHCAHTSRRIKHKQMNRFKRNGGATPLPIFGYNKPEGAKHFSEWTKLETATPILEEGLKILERSRCWTSVADYFNNQGVPTGPYCQNKVWDGAMVRRLYHNPILKGQPQRGARHSIKHHKTGRRISVKNPDGPTCRSEPHLAHFVDATQLDAVLTSMQKKTEHCGRHPDPATNVMIRTGGKRSRFPGKCATCLYCGRQMVWGGNGVAKNLMCDGSRHYQCWNSFGFDGGLAAEKVMAAITAELVQLDGFEDQFRELVQAALTSFADDPADWECLRVQEAQLQQETDNIMAAIRQCGPHGLLAEELNRLKQQEQVLANRRSRLQARSCQRPLIPATGAELRKQFEEAARDLATDSLDFGDLLRQVVTEFHVYMVRLIDGGGFYPRAKIKLSLGGIVSDMGRTPMVQEFLTRELTLDLFAPITRVDIREVAVRRCGAKEKQREVAASLNTHQATVQRALLLDRLMRERGLTSPFELVTEPPAESESRKLKRSRNPRYRFERREGYQPPGL